MILFGGWNGIKICRDDSDDIDFVDDGGIVTDPNVLDELVSDLISVGVNDPPIFQVLYAT